MELLIILLIIAVLISVFLYVRSRTYKKTNKKQELDLINLQNEIDELKKEPEKLKLELNRKLVELNTLKNQLSSANNSIQELKTRNSDLCFTREENDKKLIQANEIKEENNRLKNDLSRCEKEKQEAIFYGSRIINALQEECEQKGKELTDLLTTSSENINNLKEELSLLKKNKEELLIEFNKEKQKLELELDKYKEKIIEFKKLLEALKAERLRKLSEKNKKECSNDSIEALNTSSNYKNNRKAKAVQESNRKIPKNRVYNKKCRDDFQYYPDWSDDDNPNSNPPEYIASIDPYDHLNEEYEEYDQGALEDYNDYLFEHDN